MDYENAVPVQDIGAWYQLNFGSNTDGQQPQEIKPSVTNALGELLVYSAQVKAYAEFIMSAANAIEQDIKRDIAMDIKPILDPIVIGGAPMPPVPQPLAAVVANRDKFVEYSEKLAAVVKSIDSILARVKIKEEQQI